jgi:hypothetical protein
METGFIEAIKSIGEDLLGHVEQLPKQARFARLLDGVVSKEEYALWLGNTLRYVPNTEEVHARAARELAADPGRRHLARRHEEGAREEKGHEVLLVNDLTALAYRLTVSDVDQVIDTSPYIKAFAGLEMPLVRQRNGIGAYGIAAIMELLSSALSPRMVSNLRNSSIANVTNALSFLTVHSEADGGAEGHAAQNRALLASITDPSDQAFVLRVASLTAAFYKFFIDDFSSLEPR